MPEFRLTQISDTHLARRYRTLTDNFHRVSERIDATRGGDAVGLPEHHLVQAEQPRHLAGGDQVTVMDGIERPAHHPQPASSHE